MSDLKIFVSKLGMEKLLLRLEREKFKLSEIRKDKSLSWHDDGDGVHDNPLYHQSKDNELAQSEVVHKLSKIISSASLLKEGIRNIEQVSIGSIFKCLIHNLQSDKKEVKYIEIVGFEETDLKNNKIAYNSPIGKALIGKKINDTVLLNLPVARISYTVLQFYSSWNDIIK